MIKKIIYSDFDENTTVTNKIQRAKLVLLNSNDEILLVNTNNNYQLPGGHLEENETLDECLFREVKEETGIEIPIEHREPFIKIIYESKNYPNENENSIFIGNYYFIKADYVPDMNNTNYTKEEIEGNIRFEFIHKDKVLDVLKDSMNICKRKIVVRDTMDVIEYYLEIEK